MLICVLLHLSSSHYKKGCSSKKRRLRMASIFNQDYFYENDTLLFFFSQYCVILLQIGSFSRENQKKSCAQKIRSKTVFKMSSKKRLEM
jgi:hypothetical protein